jgi:TolB-like protein
MRRFSSGILCALAAAVVATPGAAQLARPRTVSPDAPKLLVVPFVRDNQDSTLSLLLADGVRERLRAAHLDKFNTISRANLNTVLTESGFPTDVPLDAPTVHALLRQLNAKFLVEGSMIRRGDSILVITRLSEAQGNTPQATTAQALAPASRVNSAVGADLANRMVQGFGTFDEVADCFHRLDLNDIAGATQKADQAIRLSPNNAGGYLCRSRILDARNTAADSTAALAALREAFQRDTLATVTMRRLATRYQAANDTVQLLDMLKRILTVDFRDNDLRISTIQMMVRMGQADSAVVLANKGLEYNPASVELLSAKAVAFAAAHHLDSAATIMTTYAEIDTARIDSTFLFRLTNIYRQAGDSANWLRWTERATRKFPAQLDYWYTLASQKMTHGDSAGAEAAARGLLSNIGDTSSPTAKQYAGRAHWVVSMMQIGHGNSDSAMVHANAAVNADTTIRPQVAFVYLIAGGKARVSDTTEATIDTPLTLLTQAIQYAQGNQRVIVPASFQLGIVQFSKGRMLDTHAQEGRSCEQARAARALMDQAEASIIAGVATNREIANQFLSNYIPAFKQREDTMIRQYCR